MERDARRVTAVLALAMGALAMAVAAMGSGARDEPLARVTSLYLPCLGREAGGARSHFEGIAGTMAAYPAAPSLDRFAEIAGAPSLPQRPAYRLGVDRLRR